MEPSRDYVNCSADCNGSGEPLSAGASTSERVSQARHELAGVGDCLRRTEDVKVGSDERDGNSVLGKPTAIAALQVSKRAGRRDKGSEAADRREVRGRLG